MTYTEARNCEKSQEILIRLIDRKYGITDAEREQILSIHETDLLDAALDEIVMSDEKARVLAKLG